MAQAIRAILLASATARRQEYWAADAGGPSRPLQPIRKDLVIRFRRQRLAREAIMAAKEISVKKYVVRLSGEERERLETLLRKGKSPARRVLKARILLKADVSEAGKGWSDNRIIEALETSPSMVYRVRKQLVEEGFEAVLSRKPRAMPAVARIFDGEKEAKLIAGGEAGDAGADQGLVADDSEGQADQDRREGGELRPLCYLPDGRGRHRTANVPRDFAADRGATAAATTSASVRRSMSCIQEQPTEGVRPNARENGQIRPSTKRSGYPRCW